MGKIEYGVQDYPGGDVMVTGTEPASREQAIGFARRWNERGGRTYVAVERTVEATPWVPTNTGVVGPHQGGDPE